MLENIKTLLGISSSDKDKLINLLIARTKEEVGAFTHREPTTEMNHLIESIVIYQYNRIGTEGINSESYSSVSYAYSNEYPEPIMRELKSFRKVRTI